MGGTLTQTSFAALARIAILFGSGTTQMGTDSLLRQIDQCRMGSHVDRLSTAVVDTGCSWQELTGVGKVIDYLSSITGEARRLMARNDEGQNTSGIQLYREVSLRALGFRNCQLRTSNPTHPRSLPFRFSPIAS
jgi:hypothetical protein